MILQLYRMSALISRILAIPGFRDFSSVHLLFFGPLFQEAARFGKEVSKETESQTGQLVCIFLHYNNLVIHKRYYNIET